MGSMQYGVEAQIIGNINFSKVYHAHVTCEGTVQGKINFISSSNFESYNILVSSTAESSNYDTVGASVTAGLTGVRCDKETLRPYLISILRGGGCTSGGASTAVTVSVVPAGNIDGADVQEVLEELDAEITALSAGAQLWTNTNW